jgi:hypothetical protein
MPDGQLTIDNVQCTIALRGNYALIRGNTGALPPCDKIMDNIINMGRVSSVNKTARTARVAFADRAGSDGQPYISAPLVILRREIENLWFPEVGEFVLCLLLPNGEGDGVIIGGI